MEKIAKTLAEFDSILKQENRVNYEKLRLPLPEDIITSKLKGIGLDRCELTYLLEWKDGVDTFDSANSECYIMKFGTVMCLQNIVDLYELNKSEKNWSTDLIPIISNYDGEFLLLNNSTGKNKGKVHLYSSALLFIDKPITYFDSINSMIETTIECYKDGTISYSKEEYWLNIDIDKFRLIAKRFNPLSEYWKKTTNF